MVYAKKAGKWPGQRLKKFRGQVSSALATYIHTWRRCLQLCPTYAYHQTPNGAEPWAAQETASQRYFIHEQCILHHEFYAPAVTGRITTASVPMNMEMKKAWL